MLTYFSLDVEEADLLCPVVPRERDDTGCRLRSSAEESLTDDDRKVRQGESSSSLHTRLAALRERLLSWAKQWAYTIAPSYLPGSDNYRIPIPFDGVLFSKLDTKISFDPDLAGQRHRRKGTVLPAASEADAERQHEPDHAITHPLAKKVVVPHHPLRPWEDIPPYQRSRGYNDQPAYTDDYDDFLWLPRDPLSTLDLDDTVEMRLALTTSAGGSGAIGDWPPESDAASDETRHPLDDDYWQETTRRTSVASPDAIEHMSRGAGSERRLIERIELPENIGSEIDERTGSDLVRRTTRKAAQLFRRPRTGGNRYGAAIISMRTLPNASASTLDPAPGPSIVARSPERTASSDSSAPMGTPTLQPGLVPHQSTGPVGEASPQPKNTSRLSFPPDLGRSPSGRRPNRILVSNQPSEEVLRTPTKLRDRSSSAFSPARSIAQARSASTISAQQQGLMDEVVEEERRAAKAAQKGDKEDRQREEAELPRKVERTRSMNLTIGRRRSSSRRLD